MIRSAGIDSDSFCLFSAKSITLQVTIGLFTEMCRFKKGLWRRTTPKGLKIKKFIEGTDGTLVQDSSYVGEDAWDDDSELIQDNVKKVIDSDETFKGDEKEKIKEQLGISGNGLSISLVLVRKLV